MPPTSKAKPMFLPETNEQQRFDIQLSSDIRKKLRFLAICCQEVANELGKGHTEKVYQEALSIELQKHNIFHIMEQVLPIVYKGHQIGGNHSMRLDICLQNYLDFIYECKATCTPVKQSELWQIIRYLKIKNYEYGAVVNFNQSQTGKLEIQFVVQIDGKYYLYDFLKQDGIVLNDFSMEAEIDFSPAIVEECCLEG